MQLRCGPTESDFWLPITYIRRMLEVKAIHHE